jgi:hypothetical protein
MSSLSRDSKINEGRNESVMHGAGLFLGALGAARTVQDIFDDF